MAVIVVVFLSIKCPIRLHKSSGPPGGTCDGPAPAEVCQPRQHSFQLLCDSASVTSSFSVKSSRATSGSVTVSSSVLWCLRARPPVDAAVVALLLIAVPKPVAGAGEWNAFWRGVWAAPPFLFVAKASPRLPWESLARRQRGPGSPRNPSRRRCPSKFWSDPGPSVDAVAQDPCRDSSPRAARRAVGRLGRSAILVAEFPDAIFRVNLGRRHVCHQVLRLGGATLQHCCCSEFRQCCSATSDGIWLLTGEQRTS